MWIDDDVALNALIDQAVESDRYALDTQFHREKTYYPKLALLQIRVGEVTALVDPLAINTQMLGRLFAADSCASFTLHNKISKFFSTHLDRSQSAFLTLNCRLVLSGCQRRL